MDVNGEECQDQYVIVQVNDPRSNSGKHRKKVKSGLVRISSFQQLRKIDQRIRTHFKCWIPSSYSLEGLGQGRTESIEFDEVTRAIDYIQSCDDRRVILILSAHYARNKTILSQFEQLPQIVLIYRRTPDRFMKNWFERWSMDAPCFISNTLPSRVADGAIQDLNEASQLVLTQFFLTEVILQQLLTDRAKEEFFEFCRLTYADDPRNLREVETFQTSYATKTPIHWYTKATFVFRMVSRVCASFDFVALFQIRYFICDLYFQLKQLHQAQLPRLLQTDLKVYRGVRMSSEEFDRLRIRGQLFVTRNFVSTTTEENVARFFSGETAMSDNQISVIISMHIDREGLSEKPVAFISENGQFVDEAEVMLSMGIVFRVLSCTEVRDKGIDLFKIRMIRGKEEQEIEEKLSRLRFMGSMAIGGSFLTVATVLTSIESGEYVQPMLETTGQLNNISSNLPKNIDGQAAVQNLPMNLTVKGIVSTNYTVSTAPLTSILSQSPLHTIVIVLGTVIIASAIVIPLTVILSSGMITLSFVFIQHLKSFLENNSTDCPRINCFTSFFILNPSPNYQVEHLNLTCSKSLSNLTIIQIVQRSFNETHAQQYQTFWNDSTNMTYIQTRTEIIYTWYSLPGMLIVKESFPHFIETQFYYTAGSVRNTSADTWQMWAQSICEDSLYMTGNF